MRRDPLPGFEQRLYLRQPGYGASYFTGGRLMEDVIAERARQLGDAFALQHVIDEINQLGMIPPSLIYWELTGDDRMIRELGSGRWLLVVGRRVGYAKTASRIGRVTGRGNVFPAHGNSSTSSATNEAVVGDVTAGRSVSESSVLYLSWGTDSDNGRWAFVLKAEPAAEMADAVRRTTLAQFPDPADFQLVSSAELVRVQLAGENLASLSLSSWALPSERWGCWSCGEPRKGRGILCCSKSTRGCCFPLQSSRWSAACRR